MGAPGDLQKSSKELFLIIPPFDTHPNCRCYLVDIETGEIWLGEH